MTNSFPDFWTFLETDSPKWWDFTKMRFFSKDLKKCAMDCYAYMLADEKLLNMDGPGKRKYFVAWLMKAPDALVKPQLQQDDDTPKKEFVPLTKEQIERREIELKKWKEDILAAPMSQPPPKMSHKEMAENGGWVPKKEAPIIITEEQKQKALFDHMETVRTARRKEFLHYNPDATEEQIKEYIDGIEFDF